MLVNASLTNEGNFQGERRSEEKCWPLIAVSFTRSQIGEKKTTDVGLSRVYVHLQLCSNHSQQ